MLLIIPISQLFRTKLATGQLLSPGDAFRQLAFAGGEIVSMHVRKPGRGSTLLSDRSGGRGGPFIGRYWYGGIRGRVGLGAHGPIDV
jgi:hypothetical protein